MTAIVSDNVTNTDANLVMEPNQLSPSTFVGTMADFWSTADESKLTTQYNADSRIKFLQDASMDEIRGICIQYRYFVGRYPDFLSRLLSILPHQPLKSLLASIISEEVGDGKIEDSHLVWYDNFLLSIGVTFDQIQNSLYPENDDILSNIEDLCLAKPYEFVIGMVGMGGECLCQIYLTVMYKYLRKNPHVRALGNSIDWTFWTFHVGEEDIEHRRLVREYIGDSVHGKERVQNLTNGYVYGKNTWDRFWRNNYKNTRLEES